MEELKPINKTEEPKEEIKDSSTVEAKTNPVVTDDTVGSTSTIRQVDKTFAELQAIQSTVKKFKFGDLIIPLLSIFMLLLLTFFVYIPMISSGVKFRDENRGVQEKITKLEKLNSDLDSLDISLLQTDLANSRTVIPFSLQVSNFLSYLNDSAIENGLEVKNIVTSDIAINATGTGKGLDTVMKGVSGPVKYIGSFNAILRFLGELQNSSPYLISADQIKISKAQDSLWEISLSVTGFYLNQSALPKVNLYENFQPYSQNSDILKIFSDKANKLQSNNQ